MPASGAVPAAFARGLLRVAKWLMISLGTLVGISAGLLIPFLILAKTLFAVCGETRYTRTCLVTARTVDESITKVRTRACGTLEMGSSGGGQIATGHRYRFEITRTDYRMLGDRVEITGVTDLEGNPVPPPKGTPR